MNNVPISYSNCITLICHQFKKKLINNVNYYICMFKHKLINFTPDASIMFMLYNSIFSCRLNLPHRFVDQVY